MKFLIRFVVPNVSAQKIGVDLTKTYVCEIYSQKPPPNFVKLTCPDLNGEFLMEVQEFDFLEDRIVFRGWLNYNMQYLSRAALELKSIL